MVRSLLVLAFLGIVACSSSNSLEDGDTNSAAVVTGATTPSVGTYMLGSLGNEGGVGRTNLWARLAIKTVAATSFTFTFEASSDRPQASMSQLSPIRAKLVGDAWNWDLGSDCAMSMAFNASGFALTQTGNCDFNDRFNVSGDYVKLDAYGHRPVAPPDATKPTLGKFVLGTYDGETQQRSNVYGELVILRVDETSFDYHLDVSSRYSPQASYGSNVSDTAKLENGVWSWRGALDCGADIKFDTTGLTLKQVGDCDFGNSGFNFSGEYAKSLLGE